MVTVVTSSKPLIMARTALVIVQGSPTESRRDFAMPFPVPSFTEEIIGRLT